MARVADADRPVINFDALPDAVEVSRPVSAAQSVDDLPPVIAKLVQRSYESGKAFEQTGFSDVAQAKEFVRLLKLYGTLSAKSSDKPLSVGASVVTENGNVAVRLFARDRISRPRKATAAEGAPTADAETVSGTPTNRPVKAVK